MRPIIGAAIGLVISFIGTLVKRDRDRQEEETSRRREEITDLSVYVHKGGNTDSLPENLLLYIIKKGHNTHFAPEGSATTSALSNFKKLTNNT
jgi:hypothetical protein